MAPMARHAPAARAARRARPRSTAGGRPRALARTSGTAIHRITTTTTHIDDPAATRPPRPLGERLRSLPGIGYRSFGEALDAAKPLVGALLAREGFALDYDEGFETLVTPPPPHQRAHHWRATELSQERSASLRLGGRAWRVSRSFEHSRQNLGVEISVHPSPRTPASIVECRATVTQRGHEWAREVALASLEEEEARCLERDAAAAARAAQRAAQRGEPE
ncbi:MAG: hypothetical protein QOK40_1142 [Miltoncostaeaceae bacterium]|jgi:hypothetical protein|nr:hypothetical protein [Miltoncostaeaceae bacterium]